MPGAPLRPEQNRDELIKLARVDGLEADLGIDLDGAAFKVGWESVVLDTRDGWIIRFPRDDGVAFERELALLDRLHDRLPTPIPKIIRVGRRAKFAVYRRLNGFELDLRAFTAAGSMTKDRVAASFGRFLAAMHGALNAAEISELAVPSIERDGEDHTADQLPAALRSRYDSVRDQLRTRLAARPAHPVLLHDDFHLGNLVVDAPLGRLSGVWDFSCVCIGDPSYEFRYLLGDSGEFAARVASAYAARTGREVDLGIAAAAKVLEQVSDALEEGRDPAPYLI